MQCAECYDSLCFENQRKCRNILRIYLLMHTQVCTVIDMPHNVQLVQYLRKTGVGVLPLGAAVFCTLLGLRYTAQ
jgi:hypothetical protein